MNLESIWPFVRLDSLIVDVQPGFARSPNVDDSGFPQLRTNNISDEGNIDLSLVKHVDASAPEREKYGVEPGDVIFNNTNSPVLVGRTALFDLDEEYLISNHMTRLRVYNTLMIAPFLARYLHYLWMIGYSQIRAKQWVNQAAIDQRQLSRFLIPLPPLSEQRRIVDILRQAGDLRRLRREVDAQMQDLQTALFYEMFGTPIEWQKTTPLRKLVDFVGGGTPSRKIKDYFTGDIPWATSKDIKSRYLNDAEEHITEEAIENSATQLVPARTVLVVVKSKILIHTLPVTITTRPFCFGQDLKGLVCHPNVEPQFIAAALLAQTEYILNRARGVNTEGLTLKILGQIPIPVVDSAQQQRFVEQMAIYDNIEEVATNSRQRLDNLFQSFLARAFTGELTATWREQNTELLQEEATQRDIALGLRPRGRGIEFTAELDTQAGREAFDRQVQETLRPTVAQLVKAVTPKVRLGDILKIKPLVDLNKLLKSVSAEYQATVNASLLRGTELLSEAAQEMLAESARSVQALAQSAVEAHQQQMVELAGRIAQMAVLITRRPDEEHPRYHSLRALSDEQYGVYLAALQSDGYFTAESLLDEDDLPVDNVRRTLALLETLGLVARVNVPAAPTGAALFYVPAYRAPAPNDDSRDDDLAALRSVLQD